MSEQNKLVVAYIGFGNSVCRYHLPYVARRPETVKVKYIYRREEDRVGDTERESWYPDIIFTSDIEEVMNDPEVNLVVVNTPDRFHTSYTRQAMEHGKNVLCEKPFAMTADEARETFEMAKEKGLVVMPNQNRRFDSDMAAVRNVIESGKLGDLVEIESHYDYYRPQIKDHKGLGYLYGLAVHPIDQMVGQFSLPDKVVYDVRSIDNPGVSDDYYDIDLFYGPLKTAVKTSNYVKIEHPRFTVHGKNGSFTMPQLGHQSDIKDKPGPVEISFDPLPVDKWGTLVYVGEDGKDVVEKVEPPVQDYGKIYDNLHEAIFNGADKFVKDDEVVKVLQIIEEGTALAKEAHY